MVPTHETDYVKLGKFLSLFYSAAEMPVSVKLCGGDATAAVGGNFEAARTFTIRFRDKNLFEVSLRPERAVSREKLDGCEYLLRLGFSDPVKNGFVIPRWSSILSMAEEYISLHIKDSPTISKTAHTLNISAVHLGRVIKNGTGLTFSDYVNSLRIENIKNDLLASEKLIKEIASDYGMNEYYMMRLFKKYTGETPTGFRRRRS